jgi:hypothetical protein
MIANGVTGVRDMFSDCLKNCVAATNIETVKQWRREMAAGRLIAPRILASSQILDGAKPTMELHYPIASAAAARQAVRTAKARGCDFLKIYSLLSREAYFALAAEARQQQIPFVGHYPIYLTAREAAAAGQKSFEHLDFSIAFSPRETELMKAAAATIERGKKHPLFTPLVYNTLDLNLVRAADSYDSQKLAETAQVFVKNGTWICPTLSYHHADAFHDRQEYAADPRLKYLPQELLAEWKELEDARAVWPLRMAEMQRVFPTLLKIVGEMRRAGVNFLAGTDATMIHVVPGFSLHDELAFFVKAGLTPLEALQTVTINPARFMGREKELGTIEPGKFADLALLDANPLADIRHTRRIHAVVVNGSYLPQEKLQQMLAAVASAARKK